MKNLSREDGLKTKVNQEETAADKPLNTIQSVRRALQLLKHVAREDAPIPLSVLVQRTGLNRTTVWRLMETLLKEGYVFRDPLSNNYVLGYSATQLSTNAHQRYRPLIRICRPILEKIRGETAEAALLSVPFHLEMLCVDQIDSPQVIRLKNYVDSLSPLYCTSNGKLMLGYYADDELDRFLQQPMEKKTPNTVTEPLSLKKEIILSRQRGFGMTQCEFNTSENAISCAIEQNHQPVGFITVSGPAYRITLESMLEYAPRMLELCADIQNILNEQSK